MLVSLVSKSLLGFSSVVSLIGGNGFEKIVGKTCHRIYFLNSIADPSNYVGTTICYFQ